MYITYRSTGGLFALLTLTAMALAATVLTVAVAAIMLTVALAIAGGLMVRAVLPTSWRRRTVPRVEPWSHETIETTAVHPTGSPERDLLRMDSDKE